MDVQITIDLIEKTELDESLTTPPRESVDASGKLRAVTSPELLAEDLDPAAELRITERADLRMSEEVLGQEENALTLRSPVAHLPASH